MFYVFFISAKRKLIVLNASRWLLSLGSGIFLQGKGGGDSIVWLVLEVVEENNWEDIKRIQKVSN